MMARCFPGGFVQNKGVVVGSYHGGDDAVTKGSCGGSIGGSQR